MKKGFRVRFASLCLGVLVGTAMLFSVPQTSQTIAAPLSSMETNISDYTIIYPVFSGTDSYDYFAAEMLREEINKKTGKWITLLPDSSPQTPHELLVGSTSRASSSASAAYTTVDADEYYIEVTSQDIVLQGESHMVGAATGQFVEKCLSSDGKVRPYIYDDPGRTMFYASADTAKNVIFLIGDGMGPNHIKWYNYEYPADPFGGDLLPSQGKLHTDSADSSPTDSAASATALATGHKTNNYVLGLAPDLVTVYPNIREKYDSMGMDTAVFTTDVITGATPGGFTVHIPSRGDTAGIQSAQDALVSGGHISDIQGSLVDSDCPEKLAVAIKDYSDNPNGFFIQWEEAMIDLSSHLHAEYPASGAYGMLPAMKRFNIIVKYSMVYAASDPETILIVTADHDNGAPTDTPPFSWTVMGHSPMDVRIMAMGPGTEYFDGRTMENTNTAMFLAHMTGDEGFGDRTQYEGVPMHTHNLVHVSAHAGTCLGNGNIDYYYCTECGKFYSDAAGTTEITEASTITAPAGHNYVAGTCTVCGDVQTSGAVTLPVSGSNHAVVSSDKSTAFPGETVTLTVTPDSGYNISSVIVTGAGGSRVTVSAHGGGNYTFIMPVGAVNVEAHTSVAGVAVPSYPINIPATPSNATVSFDKATASDGETVTITVTPDSGYLVSTIKVTDSTGAMITITPLGGNVYTFIMPAGAVNVSVAMRPISSGGSSGSSGSSGGGGGGSSSHSSSGTTSSLATTGTWQRDNIGWWYRYNNGSYPTNSWQLISNVWYHFRGDGYMDENCWILSASGTTWYWVGSSGAMQIGWLYYNNAWYYLYADGSMASNSWVQSSVSGAYYYLSGEGSMLVSTTTPDGYQVGADGAWIH